MHSARPPATLRIRLSPRHERWVLGLAIVLLASGVGWLIGPSLLGSTDEFGGLRDPLAPWWRAIHGAAAMGFLLVLGTLLPVHVRKAWRLRRNWRSGATVLAFAALLVGSGYALYYAGNEWLRPLLSTFHWISGLAGGAALAVHAVLGRRWAARRRQRRARRQAQAPAAP